MDQPDTSSHNNHAPSPQKHDVELPKTVGIVYSEVKREYFATEDQYITEKDALHEAQLIAKYVEKLGIKTFMYEGVPTMVTELLRDKPDMVINLVSSIRGQEYLAAIIPGIFEAIDIPYTGVGNQGFTLGCNKYLIQDLAQAHGIPVPRFQLFQSSNSTLDPNLRFPLISKLSGVHGGVEITRDAVSENEKHLRERLKYLIATYQMPILVEEFIVGREVTAMVLEGKIKKVYIGEKIFNKPDEKYIFATFEDQWLKEGEDGYKYAKYEDSHLQDIVKKAFDILLMNDYGKFDIRIDQSNRYYFLDSNCNPAFGPLEADCALANVLNQYGISFSEILRRLLLNTMRDAAGAQRLSFSDE